MVRANINWLRAAFFPELAEDIQNQDDVANFLPGSPTSIADYPLWIRILVSFFAHVEYLVIGLVTISLSAVIAVLGFNLPIESNSIFWMLMGIAAALYFADTVWGTVRSSLIDAVVTGVARRLIIWVPEIRVRVESELTSFKQVGGTETYTVTVAARFEHGGPDRQIRIVLNGADYDDETTVETPLVGTATFNDVPFGEYTVTAVAAVDGFGSAETEISVSGDTDVSLSIPSITLRDRVCDGIAEEASAYLDDLASRFSTRFDEATYLSSEMSYQIDESYVPCLLVLWAERTDNTATENSDGTIIVYDSDRLQQELTNVLRYNLDESETISLDELRERFLSAPVPHNEIQSVVNTDIENGIISDGELQKNES